MHALDLYGSVRMTMHAHARAMAQQNNTQNETQTFTMSFGEIPPARPPLVFFARSRHLGSPAGGPNSSSPHSTRDGAAWTHTWPKHQCTLLFKTSSRVSSCLTQMTQGSLKNVGFCWDFLEFHAFFWNFLEFLGISWNFMEFLGNSWKFMEFLGISWNFPRLGFVGIFWKILESIGITWNPLEFQ